MADHLAAVQMVREHGDKLAVSFLRDLALLHFCIDYRNGFRHTDNDTDERAQRFTRAGSST